jgi:hypothetical protein
MSAVFDCAADGYDAYGIFMRFATAAQNPDHPELWVSAAQHLIDHDRRQRERIAELEARHG